MTKRHISASQLNHMMLCGESYRRRYIEKDFKPVSLPAVRGIIFHDLLKMNFKYKKHSEKNLTLKILEEATVEKVKERFKKDIRLDKDQARIGYSKLEELMKIELKEILPFALKRAEEIQPIEFELPQILSHADWIYDIKYVTDLICYIDNIKCVVDHKLGGKSKSQEDADVDVGLTTYNLAFLVKNKEFPRTFMDSYTSYRTPKTKMLKTKFEAIETRRDIKDLQILISKIKIVQQINDKGIYLPAAESHWKCSQKYCEYWNDCKYINQERLKKMEEQKND